MIIYLLSSKYQHYNNDDIRQNNNFSSNVLETFFIKKNTIPKFNTFHYLKYQ